MQSGFRQLKRFVGETIESIEVVRDVIVIKFKIGAVFRIFNSRTSRNPPRVSYGADLIRNEVLRGVSINEVRVLGKPSRGELDVCGDLRLIFGNDISWFATFHAQWSGHPDVTTDMQLVCIGSEGCDDLIPQQAPEVVVPCRALHKVESLKRLMGVVDANKDRVACSADKLELRAALLSVLHVQRQIISMMLEEIP